MDMIGRRAIVTGVAAVIGSGLAAPSVRAQAPVKLKLGNDLPASHSVNVRLGEAIGAIGAETGGRLVIELFPNNQLGSDSDMLGQLRTGALEMATMPGTVLSTLIPATSLTGVGFAFTGYDTVWPAMDGSVGDYIRTAIAKTSLVPFERTWDNGFRQITSGTRQIRAPEDLRNFKIRIPVVPLWVSMFAAIGAAPTSIPLSEVYSALQTRIVDGQENPLALIDATKFWEVQKYCALTNHAWDGFWLLASRRVWGGIPGELQAVMQKHFNAAAVQQRGDSALASANVQKVLEGKGLVFNTTDTARFRQALANTNFYGEWKGKLGADAWNLLESAVGRIG